MRFDISEFDGPFMQLKGYLSIEIKNIDIILNMIIPSKTKTSKIFKNQSTYSAS